MVECTLQPAMVQAQIHPSRHWPLCEHSAPSTIILHLPRFSWDKKMEGTGKVPKNRSFWVTSERVYSITIKNDHF